VFGRTEHRARVSKALLHHCNEAMMETHAVPIARSELEFILKSGGDTLKKVIRAISCRKVSLDLKNSSLLVEGSVLRMQSE
jgi:hypothetical protein